MLTLVSGTQALSPTLKTFFLGKGGTEPYVYSVEPGGAGGTINAGTGEYTAPLVTGVDTVKVTDADDNEASLEIRVGTALELFCDIIEKEMELEEGRVYLWDQKINQPKDSDLYVAVGILTAKPFGNRNRFDNGESDQSVNMLAVLQLDVISRGPEARDRKEEVIMALASNYSQSQQELNSFHVGRISTAFRNLSQEDGAAIPYRFSIDVQVQYAVTKRKAVPYYDEFPDPPLTIDEVEP